MKKVYISAILATVILSGCGEKQEDSVAETTKSATEQTKAVAEPIAQGIYGAKTQEVTQSVPIEMHAAAEQKGAYQPPAPVAVEVAEVLDFKDAGGYIYIQIQEANGQLLWIAGPKAVVKVGQKVSFAPQMMMQDFPSKALGKTFDRLLFVAAIAPLKDGASTTTAAATKEDDCSNCDTHKAQRAAKDLEQMVKDSSSKVVDEVKNVASTVAAAATEVVDSAAKAVKQVIAKPSGGYTIAELYSKKSDLNGTSVSVAGRVTKVSKGIMGRDWIHIVDDSRDASAGDFTITSPSSNVNVDEVVVVTGKLNTDVDFGYGYFYPVIIENATFSK